MQEDIGFGGLDLIIVRREKLFRVSRQQIVIGPAQLLHDGQHTMLGFSGFAKRMQAQRHGSRRQRVQMVVQGLEEVSRPRQRLFRAPAQICGDVGGDGGFGETAQRVVPDRAVFQLLDLVDQGVNVAQLVIETGRREGGRLVRDGGRPPAADRLNGFGHIVLDIGVDHHRIADREMGVVIGPQAAILARRPFLGPVGAQMNDGVGLKPLADHQIGGEIEMARRNQRVVIALADRVGPRRLGQHQQLAVVLGGDDKSWLAVNFVNRPMVFRRAPAFGDARADRVGQGVEPGLIPGDGEGLRQPLSQKRFKPLGMVIAAHHGLEVRDELVLGAGLHVIVGFIERRGDALNRHRDVEV